MPRTHTVNWVNCFYLVPLKSLTGMNGNKEIDGSGASLTHRAGSHFLQVSAVR